MAQLAGHAPPRARRRQGAGVVLRLPGQAERPRARRLRGARAGGRHRRRRRRARRTSPTSSAHGRRATLPSRAPARPADRRAHRRGGRQRGRRAAARGRDRLRRGQHRRACGRRAPPRARPATTGSTLTAAPSARACPSPTGAAVACPDRKVVCLEADGSAMYTLQALWTQAREGLDVTTVIFNNRLLRHPQPRAQPGRRRSAGPEGARHARPVPPRPRLRRAGEGHGRRGAARRPPRSLTALERASPSRARTSSRPCCRRGSDPHQRVAGYGVSECDSAAGGHPNGTGALRRASGRD